MLQKPPLLPTPPKLYDDKYMQQLLRTLYLYFQQGANPGTLYGTDLVLTNLPGSGASLPAGALWRNGNVVYIVLESDVYAPSFLATGSVGEVTVTVV